MITFVKQEQTVINKTDNLMKRQIFCFEIVISKISNCCFLRKSQKYMVRYGLHSGCNNLLTCKKYKMVKTRHSHPFWEILYGKSVCIN